VWIIFPDRIQDIIMFKEVFFMADHDHSYKQLFSHPQLVRDLLEGFVKEEWVGDLNTDTLERVNGSFVSDDLRERIFIC
jgi:hypothetical protein